MFLNILGVRERNSLDITEVWRNASSDSYGAKLYVSTFSLDWNNGRSAVLKSIHKKERSCEVKSTSISDKKCHSMLSWIRWF